MDTSKLRKRMPVSTLFDPKIVVPAIGQAFVKLNPATLIKNPVIFVLEVVTALTTVLLVRDLVQHHAGIGFTFQIVLWLWFTVLFANFAEAVAEGRGKAQADSLRKTRTETRAKRILMPDNHEVLKACPAEDLRGRRSGGVRGRRRHPRRWRRDRRHRLGQRSRHYRRIRAGDPRIRRRPLGGDRRHHRHFRPDRRSASPRRPARRSSIA